MIAVKNQVHFDIAEGDTEDELFNALRDGGTRRQHLGTAGFFSVRLVHPLHPIQVTFEVRLTVERIARSNRSNCWLIAGQVENVEKIPDTGVSPGMSYTGTYFNNGRFAAGHLQFS